MKPDQTRVVAHETKPARARLSDPQNVGEVRDARGGAGSISVDDVAFTAPESQRSALSAAIVSVHTSLGAARPSGAGDVVQMRRESGGTVAPAQALQATARHGVQGTPTSLPFRERIQAAFGRHDVSGVQAHTGGRATEASRAMGAKAYATGRAIAFAGTPDLHTTAHEAVHVLQQQRGVAVEGGVGRDGDHYEREADSIADAVVRGGNVERALDRVVGASGGTTAVVQRKPDPSAEASASGAAARPEQDHTPAEVTESRDLGLVREHTKESLDLLGDAMQAYQVNMATAEATAWNSFVHHTGGDCRIALPSATWLDLANSYLNTGFGLLTVTPIIERAGLGGSVKVLADLISGTITNMVWGLIWQLLSPLPNTEQLLDDVLKRVGEDSNKIIAQAMQRVASPLPEWQAMRSQLRRAADRAQTTDELDELRAWIEHEATSVRGIEFEAKPLELALLRKWVLERSADPETAGRGVNSVSHDAAKRRLREADRLAVEDGATQERTMYLHQLRYLLVKMKLDPEPALASLSEHVDEYLRTKGPMRSNSRGWRRYFGYFVDKWSYRFTRPKRETIGGIKVPPPSTWTMTVELDCSGDSIYLEQVNFEDDLGGTGRRTWSNEP